MTTTLHFHLLVLLFDKYIQSTAYVCTGHWKYNRGKTDKIPAIPKLSL